MSISIGVHKIAFLYLRSQIAKLVIDSLDILGGSAGLPVL